MSNVLLISGPAGAGKSTTALEFIKQAKGTWAYINQDETRQMVKAGYATADGYESDWSNDTKAQWKVSIPICCDIARRYIEHGINCLLDFNASPEEFMQWKKHLDGIEYQLVILLPDEATVLLRNSHRDERSKLKDNKIIQNYEKLIEWKNKDAVIIDNNGGSLSETVTKLNDLLVGTC